MSERIDQFCEILRVKLTSIDNNMQALKAKIDSKAANRSSRTSKVIWTASRNASRKIVRNSQPRRPTSRIGAKSARRLRDEKIAEWKAKLEKAKLKGRAEAAERYAAGAARRRLAAVDEAEQA